MKIGTTPVIAREFNVLFLCTGNSARSIMAECAIERWGRGRFHGFSAGSHPRGELHPLTLELLRELAYETARLRSKSWDEFARADSPPLDFVFTVCDQAAGEVCPVWPGQPITAHWGVEDPAAFNGNAQAQRRFFMRTYLELESRIKIFSSLPKSIRSTASPSKRAREKLAERGGLRIDEYIDEERMKRRAQAASTNRRVAGDAA